MRRVRLEAVAAVAVLTASTLLPGHPAHHFAHSVPLITIGLDDIARGEYSFSEGEDGSWSAPNRAQGIRTRADATGVSLTPRGPDPALWRLSLRLRAFGREGALHPVPRAVVRAKGARVEQHRDSLGLTEWYVNEPGGIEQGFTIEEPPAAGAPESRLVLEIGHSGNLVANADGNDAIAFAAPDGTLSLRQSGLVVLDAAGRRVPAEMRLVPGAIRIAIADQGRPYPLVVDPTIVTPAWTALGDQFEERFGESVSGAGDVNGDGYADVIVGAPRFDGGNFDEGRAFVFLGSPAGPASQPAWTADGGQAGAWFGYSVASAGDVNNDGYDDVIVGARLFDNVQVDEGRAFVYLGSAAGLGTVPVWTAEPDQNGAKFGSSVAPAGDVNGDGYADVIVGAPDFDTPFNTDEGHAFLYLGSAAGPSGSPAWTAGSGLFSSAFGFAVASAGDVNGDGLDDVIVGAPLYDNTGFSDEGRAFVYGGSASGLSPNPIWTADSGKTLARLGSSVSSAGDVDGDGFDDVIVGAPFYDSGRAFVYHGSPAGPSLSSDWFAKSTLSPAEFGTAVAGVGDVDGDGFGDVVIGAPRVDDQSIVAVGLIKAYTGGVNGLGNQAAFSAQETQPNAQLGGSLARAGDVNGDGRGDFIAGAIGLNNTSLQVESSGGAHLYLGFGGQPCVPSAEICNGIDDDCDGQVDEGLGSTSCGIGACARTVNACVGGVPQTCTPGTPTAETCNNIDDDCDGQVDEGLGSTSCGIGACARTVNACVGGVPQTCTPGTPTAEICNNIDDDCDGQVDESLGSTSCGIGACARTVNACVGGVPQTCTPGTPTAETCNNIDDDCDGAIDNNLGTVTCGVGACTRTASSCVGGVPQNCTPGTPTAETCNGIDDDCDGATDESLGSTTCGTGACSRTVNNCVGGVPQTCTPGTPTAETCNNIDDDCDGLVDDGFDLDGDLFTTCGGDCNDAAAAVHPGAPEICNGTDDNCNLLVDEGFGDSDGDGLNDCVDPDDDNDLVADASDCAPLVNSVSAVPGEVGQTVRFTAGGSQGSFSWTRIAQANVHNVYRSTWNRLTGAWNDTLACMVSEATGSSVVDLSNPPRGSAFFYVITGSNRCGEGTAGSGTNGQPRSIPSHCAPLGLDTDADAVLDIDDNCPVLANAGQLDTDHDGRGTACDNCAAVSNPGQEDGDTNGIGDICQDLDHDGYTDDVDCNDNNPSVNPGASEVCNGADDDCNGATDENLGTTFCGLGECLRTVATCVGGVIQTCTPGTPAPEICNNLDDDCDGTRDDNLGSITCGVGACARTVNSCIGGVIQTCTPGTPGTEICNNIDDDCDGATDENLGSTTCGVGACSRTVNNCVGGVPQACTPGSPTTETCNGLDDDCDGTIDDEFVPTPTTCGTGACANTGSTACVGGTVVDTCTPLPAQLVAVDFGSSMTYRANLDGPPQGQAVIQAGSPMRYLVNSSDPGIGLNWTGRTFNDSTWAGGQSGAPYGVGYDIDPPPNASNLIKTSVPAGTFSVYTRARFSIPNRLQVRGLFLGADFDDGFVAYLNGREVARSSMPSGDPAWNTDAISHESSNGATPDYGKLIDISEIGLNELRDGVNILAIGVWNSGAPSSPDLVLVPKLTVALDWTLEGSADPSWSVGRYGVGYETETAPPNASSLIPTAVPPGTLSIYTRALFQVSNPGMISGMFLGADYDDGFVAYINGVEVARASMPAGAPNWNTDAALHESSNGAAPNFGTPIDISAAIPLLHTGNNILAVGVWNSGGPASTDLVLVPRLVINGRCGP